MERDNDGATPAHFAAARGKMCFITFHQHHYYHIRSSASFSGHVSLLRWLLTHGAIVDTDDLGGTPLHDAAEHGQMEVSSISLTQCQ